MDKIDRLLDAVEHTDQYSSVDIEGMLQDPKIKEVFDLLDKTKSSLQPISNPDIGSEWERFKNNHADFKSDHHFRLSYIFSRKVAAGIAICIVSITAVAAIVGIGADYFNRQMPDPDTTP